MERTVMRRINDLATAIAEKQQIGQREAEHFLLTMVDVINDALHYEKQLKVKGLGTFKVSAVSARESVSVKTGQRITIGQREKISFSPEASMRDLVNKPFAQFETVVVNDGVSFDEIDAKYKNTLTESPEDVDAEDVADVPSAASEPVEEPVEELANEASEEFVAPLAPVVEVPVAELAEESIEEAQEEIQEEPQEEIQ
jgi:nucleoid DNA-binding protein